jgi:uncharacterized membrane protein YedE/YeeE
MRFFAWTFFASTMLVSMSAAAQEADDANGPLAPVEVAPSPASVAPAEAPDETEWNSPALAITGSVFATIGLASVITGAAFIAHDAEQNEECPTDQPCGMGFGGLFGMIGVAGGGLFILAGVPMIVAGAWQVPSDDAGEPPATVQLRAGAGRIEVLGTF